MRDPSAPVISVVIPCYQEAARVASAIAGYRACVQALGLKSELILVDDGSTDGTTERANSLMVGQDELRCISVRHAGKGAALRTGIEAASGAWIVLADADWSMSPDQTPALLPAETGEEIGASKGVMIGCREHTHSRRIGEPFYRHFLGRCFNHLVRLLLVPGVSDTQCGFKGLSAQTGKKLCLLTEESGWAFDVELLLLARRAGQPVIPVPIRWEYDPDSRVSALRDSILMGLALIRIGFRHGFRTGREPVSAKAGDTCPPDGSVGPGLQP